MGGVSGLGSRSTMPFSWLIIPISKELDMPFNSRRRTFLAQLTGLTSIGGVVASGRSATAQSGRSEQNRSGTERWDTAWLDGFKGRHKQLYDLMWHTLK